MMLKDGEIIGHVTQHAPKWTTYNKRKFKDEMLKAIKFIDDEIRKSKGGNTNGAR